MAQTNLGRAFPALDHTKPGFNQDTDGIHADDLVSSKNAGLGIMRVARAIYSFARDGGAQGLITPAAAYNAVIPDNAVIVGGTINATTAVAGVGASIAVGTSAGSAANSLKAATAITAFTTDALINAVPVFATPVKMTAAGSITLTVSAADLTAGVVEVTLFYYVAAA